MAGETRCTKLRGRPLVEYQLEITSTDRRHLGTDDDLIVASDARDLRLLGEENSSLRHNGNPHHLACPARHDTPHSDT